MHSDNPDLSIVLHITCQYLFILTSTGISVSLFLSTLKFVIFFNLPIEFGSSW